MKARAEQADTYSVGYCYPSSPLARTLGRSRTGCYYVATPEKMRPFSTFEQALGHASTTGLQPERWSLDHPLNASYRPNHQAAHLQQQL